MKRYGLIGYPLTHSFSPSFFNEKFSKSNLDATYESIEIEDLSNAMPHFEFSLYHGLNVTIPHKERIISFLDGLSNEARLIGAVNCIEIAGAQSIGHNTDWIGFKRAIERLIKPYHQSALVLGSGGSSKAVRFALEALKIKYQVISRTGVNTYEALQEKDVQSNLVIINTTPLGMYPNVKLKPAIPFNAISKNHLVFDLIYNPDQTTFLKECKAHGAQVKNGLEMLELQAEASWEIWNS